MDHGGSRPWRISFARTAWPMLVSAVVAAALYGCNRSDAPAGSGEAVRTPVPGAPADHPPAVRGSGPAEGGTSIGGMTNGQGGSGGGQDGVGGSPGSRSATGGDGATEDQKPADPKPATPGSGG